MTQATIRDINHVAIIMDGNGRWAEARGLERLDGHMRGARMVKKIVRASKTFGVKHLTLYAFSTENWKRSEKEVSGLMRIFRRYILSESADMLAEGVCLKFIGQRDKLDEKLIYLMDWIEQQTAQNTALHLTIALNYGGRDELVRASRKMAEAVKAGDLKPAEITEETISGYLDTAGTPDPDLVIRTSGEFRTSNFLPWQSSYAEYAFIDESWPDFTVALYEQAISNYRRRERRFGSVIGK
ncbi:MAG: di-trans,poly-cis-decaprenylcistransferase [Proteobacteria bacterium]|nr:di-trans,poly-cis-decaprenylcistransferase [Pseudomonadota bacterium]